MRLDTVDHIFGLCMSVVFICLAICSVAGTLYLIYYMLNTVLG